MTIEAFRQQMQITAAEQERERKKSSSNGLPPEYRGAITPRQCAIVKNNIAVTKRQCSG